MKYDIQAFIDRAKSNETSTRKASLHHKERDKHEYALYLDGRADGIKSTLALLETCKKT